MADLLTFIENKRKIVVFLFFAVFLGVGLCAFEDYGVSWDEYFQRNIGNMSLDYVLKGDKTLLASADRHYGCIFEIFLVALERGLHLTGRNGAVIFVRHLINFLLFFMGVIFFYRLCRYRFQNWKTGLLGSLFLILSPRIFADAFYNSKDLPFLSFFIIAVFTLIRFIDKPTVFRAWIHALICALLIDIRIGGLLVPLFTFIIVLADIFVLRPSRANTVRSLVRFLWFVLFWLLMAVLFWPFLWKDPWGNFREALQFMLHFKGFPGVVVYLGHHVPIGYLPWHYIPVWIGISTPLVYSAFGLIGVLSAVCACIPHPVRFYQDRKYDLLFLGWFLLPPLTAMICRSSLYDGWRHMYFIYPSMLIFSLIGLRFVFGALRKKLQGTLYQAARGALITAVAFNLLHVAVFMAVNHPFQNVYFNILAGLNREEIKNKFELDYWGLSYRKALEYIVKNDPADQIRICAANAPAWFNADLLPVRDRRRLFFVFHPEQAKYFLTNFRLHEMDYPCKNEFFSIKVEGVKIMVVYKLRPS